MAYVYSVASGNWHDGSTWHTGAEPTPYDVPIIQEPHTVVLYISRECGHGGVHPHGSEGITVRGNLVFYPTTNPMLTVKGPINIISTGTIQIGTPSTPMSGPGLAGLTHRGQGGYQAPFMWLRIQGHLMAYGDPLYRRAGLFCRKTTLAAPASAGAGVTLTFVDPCGYQAGTELVIGTGANPSREIFNDAGIYSATTYRPETVTVTAPGGDAYSAVATLAYDHDAGDVVFQKDSNIYIGGDRFDYFWGTTRMSVRMEGESEWMQNPGYTGQWPGQIECDNVTFGRGTDMLHFVGNRCDVDDSKVKITNCSAYDITGSFLKFDNTGYTNIKNTSLKLDRLHAVDCVNGIHVTSIPKTYLKVGEAHFLNLTGSGIKSEGTGTDDAGIDINNYTYVADPNAISGGSGANAIENKGGFINIKQTFNSYVANTHIYQDCYDDQPSGRPLLHYKNAKLYNATGKGVYINEAMGRIVQFDDVVIRNASGSGVELAGRYKHSFNCNGCMFDNCNRAGNDPGGAITLVSPTAVPTSWTYQFKNCTFGTNAVNNRANIMLENSSSFTSSGRLVLSDCTFKKPGPVTLGYGQWWKAKAWCVYDSNLADVDLRTQFTQGRSYEFVNISALDESDVDQWPIEYPGITHFAVVGGGGEVYNESTTVIDSTLGMKMCPWSVITPCPGNKVAPMRIPVTKGKIIDVGVSLRKNVTMPEGLRPAMVVRGLGIDERVEMSDAIDTWEEVSLKKAVAESGFLKMWIEGGANHHAGAIDNQFQPLALGNVISYADAFTLNFSDPVNIQTHPTLSTDLVSYYTFTTDATDVTGNGHDGVVTGAAHQGSGYYYFNNNDYITIDHHVDFSNPSFSVSFWMNTSSTAPGQVIMAKRADVMQWQFSTYDLLPGLGVRLDIGIGPLETYYVRKPGLPTTQWEHIVGTYDGWTLKIYSNGELINATSTPRGPNYASDTPIVLGAAATGASAPYTGRSNFMLDGSIDDTGIWGRALTKDEVIQLYNNGNKLTY